MNLDQMSVQFHEKGKRHQENVKLKIEELKKKGTADAKKKEKENDYMQRMEKAALEAFKKDIAADPELAKQYNVKLPGEVVEGPQLPEGYKRPPPAEEVEEALTEEAADVGKEGGEEVKEGEWWEVMSDMGYPYYWNTVTGETVWVAPKKYVSLADQEAERQSETKDTQKAAPASVDEIPLPTTVDSIPLPGEHTSHLPVTPTEESEEDEEEDVKQDRNARGVYGVWARVQQEQPPEEVDLQLPQTETQEMMIPVPVAKEEVKVKFKEKRVTSLGSKKSGPVAFKKRKLGEGARNVRKRGCDD